MGKHSVKPDHFATVVSLHYFESAYNKLWTSAYFLCFSVTCVASDFNDAKGDAIISERNECEVINQVNSRANTAVHIIYNSQLFAGIYSAISFT